MLLCIFSHLAESMQQQQPSYALRRGGCHRKYPWALLTVHMIHPVQDELTVSRHCRKHQHQLFMNMWQMQVVCHQLNWMSTLLIVLMYTVLCSLHICWIICVNKEVWLHLSHAKYKLAMMTKSMHTLHNCKEKKPLITIAIHHCPHIHTVQTTDCVIYTAYNKPKPVETQQSHPINMYAF